MLVASGVDGSPRKELGEPSPMVTQQDGTTHYEFWSLGGGDWPQLYMSPPELDMDTAIDGGVPREVVQRLQELPVSEGWVDGKATHYGHGYETGESCGHPGTPCDLGCGSGTYSSSNTSIVAVSPTRYADWPCGTVFEVCGVSGCIFGTRHDACPGCAANHLDLSEAGITAVCGQLGTCTIRFRIIP